MIDTSGRPSVGVKVQDFSPSPIDLAMALIHNEDMPATTINTGTAGEGTVAMFDLTTTGMVAQAAAMKAVGLMPERSVW